MPILKIGVRAGGEFVFEGESVFEGDVYPTYPRLARQGGGCAPALCRVVTHRHV